MKLGSPVRYLLNFALPFALMTAVQPAFADEGSGPLAPGKEAGVQTAQQGPNMDKLAVVGGLALGLVAIYLIAGTHYNAPSKAKSATTTH